MIVIRRDVYVFMQFVPPTTTSLPNPEIHHLTTLVVPLENLKVYAGPMK